jgi:thymidylate synthase
MSQEAEKHYLRLLKNIYETGIPVKNTRTGKKCKTLLHQTFQYMPNEFPVLTTKKVNWKGAIAEIIGYLRGCTNAAEFDKLGTKTWYANANKTKAWLDNPNRKGDGDMGKVYGAVARDFGGIDLVRQVYEHLKVGVDDRGEIITFWKPDEFDKGCLRPCMYEHHFSLVEGKLFLHSTQRSCDVPLGLPYNMIQCYVLLHLMAQITGHKAGIATHNIVNAHIYEDQLSLVPEQLSRDLYTAPKLKINPKIKTLEDVMTWVTVDDFEIIGYESHPHIPYPFSE